SWDKYYREYENNTVSTGSTTYRHYSEFENQFFLTDNLSSYAYYEFANDLDMIRDYQQFMSEKTLGSDLGVDHFFNYSANYLAWSLESSFKRNQLVPSSKTFDHSYVQVLPELKYTTIPFNLINFTNDNSVKLIAGHEGTLTH